MRGIQYLYGSRTPPPEERTPPPVIIETNEIEPAVVSHRAAHQRSVSVNVIRVQNSAFAKLLLSLLHYAKIIHHDIDNGWKYTDLMETIS